MRDHSGRFRPSGGRLSAPCSARFRQHCLNNVVVVVEPEPPRPDLLGLYQGRPLTSRSVWDWIHDAG